MAAASFITAPGGQACHAPGRSRCTVRCSMRGAAVGNRTDWQSSCAVLSSKVAYSATANVVALAPAADSTNGAVLDLVMPVRTGFDGGAKNLNLPQPLRTADLSPVPMHGSKLRVAYKGVPGAYGEMAAGQAYAGCDAIPCDEFEVAFQAVENWIADRAVLPVENSLDGSIHRNYDLLLRHRLHIVGEVQLSVHHCLVALPGVRKEDITRIISHPQALAQCEHTLDRMGLNVVRQAFDDTAGAAEHVAANGLRDAAAIASSPAAELYGMEVLADGIQDDSGNVTRFVMLAREPIMPRTDRPFKTSIVFAANEKEGTSVLFKVLSAFAFRDITVSKIESRPHRHRPIRIVDDAKHGTTGKHFEYMFHVDLQASLADPRVQKALDQVQQFTSFLRVLGSYPVNDAGSSSTVTLSDSSPVASSC